jgi:hypothetical protein
MILHLGLPETARLHTPKMAAVVDQRIGSRVAVAERFPHPRQSGRSSNVGESKQGKMVRGSMRTRDSGWHLEKGGSVEGTIHLARAGEMFW